jgi:hypothetical protein
MCILCLTNEPVYEAAVFLNMSEDAALHDNHDKMKELGSLEANFILQSVRTPTQLEPSYLISPCQDLMNLTLSLINHHSSTTIFNLRLSL